MVYEHFHDATQWHIEELTSRIIAQSGIPTDRYHVGKIILQSLRDDPDFISQIDAGTGESETNGSVLKRVIRCALSMKKAGIKTGDTIVVMAPNHLDVVIPFYAGLCLGAIFTAVDRFLLVNELVDAFQAVSPKIIFCHSAKTTDIGKALEKCNLESKIVTFDRVENFTHFADFLKDGEDKYAEENFRASDFNTEETIAALVPTSGTTGVPKWVASTHKNFTMMTPFVYCRTTKIPPFQSFLLTSPLQWLSATMNLIISPFLKYTRIQTSKETTREHIYEMINKYQPKCMIISPTMLATLIHPDERIKCDFTCFEYVLVGGNTILPALLDEFRSIVPNTVVTSAYGMTEASGLTFVHCYSSPPTSVGKPLGCLEYKIVDENGDEIKEPHKKGELWMKGPGFCKGYYKNPEATRKAFTEDGWYRSGDLFYRDEHWNYYFVERLKSLLKYKGYHVSPAEVEMVIRQHPGVLDVAVLGIKDLECGDLPVACIVPKPGPKPSAQEIKDLVKGSLSETKHLRGGVVFFDKFPTTASTKVHRRKLSEMIQHMERE